jgi:regulator of PEP synthase PpsR (kinase-PPPase family)
MPRAKTPAILIVSDGTGDTARRVLEAAAVQFEGQRYRKTMRAGVRSPEEVERIVDEAAKSGAVIFYTLVAEETRRAMRKTSGRRLVPTVDVLGPAFSALHDQFKRKRGETPGLLRALDRDRSDRMTAFDYTLTHDDGQRPHELARADVVLAGVSRASKSSTCFFLAFQGVRAANVPLVPGVPPPPHLLDLPPDRVIGLRVNLDRLIAVREARAQDLGMRGAEAYLDRQAISREVIAANRIMDKQGWHSVDVSYLAIEEIAKEVMRLRRLTGSRPW